MKFLPITLFVLVTALASNAHGQITGIISDAHTKIPVEGAVILSASDTAVSTKDGKFSSGAKAGTTIVIRHVAYRTDSIRLNSQQNFYAIELTEITVPLEQILVQAPYFTAKLIEMPVSASILTRQTLLVSSELEMAGTINLVPGIYMHSGSLNTSRILIRGVGSRSPYGTNRIKAYFDNIPLSQTDGTTVIEDIPLSFIHKITAIKGSRSAMYGSGLGGILILQGITPANKGIHSSIRLEAGIFGSVVSNLTITGKSKSTAGLISYSHTQTDGFRQNSTYNRNNLMMQSRVEKKKYNLKLLLNYTDVKAYIPSSIDSLTYTTKPESAAPSWLAVKGFEEYSKLLGGLSESVNLAKDFTNTTVLSFAFSDSYESRPFNILDDNFGMAVIKSWFKYGPKNFHTEVGIDLQYEYYNAQFLETLQGVSGDLLNEYSEYRASRNLFFELGYTFSPKFSLEAGVNLNMLSYDMTETPKDSLANKKKYNYPAVLSPFAGINYKITESVSLYSSAGQGFSHPSAEETLLPQGTFNPNLMPENGYTFDFGVRLNSAKSVFYFDAAWYLILIDNMLVTQRISEDEFISKNAGSSINQGIETTFLLRSVKPPARFLPATELNISFAGSMNQFRQFIDDNEDYSGNFLPGIPQFTFNSLLTLNFRSRFNLDFQLNSTGRQFLNDENTLTYPGYSLLNMKAGYKLNIRKKVLTGIYFGIKNMTNQNYASMILVNAPELAGRSPRYYYPGMPRYFYGGISFSF